MDKATDVLITQLENELVVMNKLITTLELENRKLRVLLAERLGRYALQDAPVPRVMFIGPHDGELYRTGDEAIAAVLRDGFVGLTTPKLG